MVKILFHYKQARNLVISWIIMGWVLNIVVSVRVNGPIGLLYGVGFPVVISGSGAALLLFILPLLVLVSGICLLGLLPYAQQVERRRQVAAAASLTGMRVLSTDEQPVPDETALTLPCTIRLKPDLKRIPGSCALVVLLTIGSVGILILASTGISSLSLLLFAGTNLFTFLSIVGAVLVVSYLRIEVTNEGLSIRQVGNDQFIRWDEARLFAIDPIVPMRGRSAIYYELSGPTNIVRWLRYRQNMSFLYKMSKPARPFDEYDRQMEALLSMIAAKTRLQLCDVR